MSVTFDIPTSVTVSVTESTALGELGNVATLGAGVGMDRKYSSLFGPGVGAAVSAITHD